MKVRWWLAVIVLVFGVWIPFPGQPMFLGAVVIEQEGVVPGQRDSHQGIPLSTLCYVVWVEGVEVQRRRQPRRNPMRRWRKLMRRLAKEQRRAARRAQRQPQCKAEVVEIAAAPIKDPAVIAVKSDGQPIDRKSVGRPATVATNHVFCPTEGCRGYGQSGPHHNHWIVGYGTYTTKSGQVRQMFQCQWCK